MSVKQPVCVKCNRTESIYWNKAEDGVIICSDCYEVGNSGTSCKDNETDKSKNEDNGPRIPTRRSTRTTVNTKSRTPHVMPKKGKGRRAIFKKTCMKAPASVATVVTSDHIFYQRQFYKIGDIVSVRGTDAKLYYCQLRGFLTDQYCEKSAVISWLIPSDRSPPPEEGFDPATYMLGFEEDIPRKMSCFTFVMHAPSDYYKCKNSPFPPVSYESFSDSRLSMPS